MVEDVELLLHFRDFILQMQEEAYMYLAESPENDEITVAVDERGETRITMPASFD